MHKDECNILGMDSPFKGWHNDRYFDMRSDPNSICIDIPRGDLFSLLSSELSATFLVSFIMHLIYLSSGISPISSLGQSPSVICKDSDSSPYSTVVILGIAAITSPKSTFKLIAGINLKDRF